MSVFRISKSSYYAENHSENVQLK